MKHAPEMRVSSAAAGSPAPDEMALRGLLVAIQRATTTVDEETAALKANARLDHAEFRRRKDLCLLDLSRRSIATAQAARRPELMVALEALKSAVIENQKTLRVHLSAARTVAEIFMRAIADEESDFTYDHDIRQSRRR